MNAATKASVIGQYSFEGDSIPDFSEFDSTSVIEEYIGERYVPTYLYTDIRFRKKITKLDTNYSVSREATGSLQFFFVYGKH